MRASTISLERTGLVTMVCRVRFFNVRRQAQRAEKKGEQQRQVASAVQHDVQVQPRRIAAGRVEKPAGEEEDDHKHGENHDHPPAHRLFDRQPGQREQRAAATSSASRRASPQAPSTSPGCPIGPPRRIANTQETSRKMTDATAKQQANRTPRGEATPETASHHWFRRAWFALLRSGRLRRRPQPRRRARGDRDGPRSRE